MIATYVKHTSPRLSQDETCEYAHLVFELVGTNELVKIVITTKEPAWSIKHALKAVRHEPVELDGKYSLNQLLYRLHGSQGNKVELEAYEREYGNVWAFVEPKIIKYYKIVRAA